MTTLNIYACGGNGINQGKSFLRYSNKVNDGFALINTYFIDTSTSNLTDEIPTENFYHVEDTSGDQLLKGSGKKRDSNYEPISARRKEILHKFKPADINIVLHSASGGTGSVSGPVLVSELLDRGESVIVILTGSSTSKIETRNTIKTLESYEGISQKRNLPVNVFYRENSSDTPRGRVDQDVQTAIVVLAGLFSEQNRELDAADLKNFLNYHNVTSHKPGLSYLDFFSRKIEIERHQVLQSVVSLTDDDTPADMTNVLVEYQANGFVPDSIKQHIPTPLPIYGAIIGGVFAPIVDKLQKKLKEYEDLRSTVSIKPLEVNSETMSDDGLAF